MQKLDENFLETSLKIQAAITAEQNECLQQVYVHEKEVYLRRITAPLRHKLEPVIDLFGETKGGGRGKKK